MTDSDSLTAASPPTELECVRATLRGDPDRAAPGLGPVLPPLVELLELKDESLRLANDRATELQRKLGEQAELHEALAENFRREVTLRGSYAGMPATEVMPTRAAAWGKGRTLPGGLRRRRASMTTWSRWPCSSPSTRPSPGL